MESEADKQKQPGIKPMIDEQPLPEGELVGEVLSVISLKYASDSSDPEHVVHRNSFRDLHRPNLSHLEWVSQSQSKENVRSIAPQSLYKTRYHCHRVLTKSTPYRLLNRQENLGGSWTRREGLWLCLHARESIRRIRQF